jgi:outer membrane murein-binding lipoprotein Lpp
LTVKKVALSLVILAGCSNTPAEESVAPTTVTLASTGPADPQMDQPEAQSPQTALGATTTSVTPSRAPESTIPVFVPPRPVQTTRLSVSPSNVEKRTGSELSDCIAKYESTNGALDSNLYQFVPGTWRAYGGTGDPGDASVEEQTRIFWLAWNDAGEHHWAAQKGRCF